MTQSLNDHLSHSARRGQAAVRDRLQRTAIIFGCLREALAFLGTCSSRHAAEAETEGAVGAHEEGQTGARVVAAQPAVTSEEGFGGVISHAPFHDRAGQVPGNVGWAGIEMIVAMR